VNGPDLVLIVLFRNAVTYGFHALLGALETHETATRYEVQFAESAQATIDAIRAASAKTLVLWSFYPPDFAPLSEEVQAIKAAAPGAIHVAGGVHAHRRTGPNPRRRLGRGRHRRGDTTLLKLVDAGGDYTAVPGLVYRDGGIVKTGRVERQPLDTYRAFSLRWNRFSALEISRGCIFACPYKRELPSQVLWREHLHERRRVHDRNTVRGQTSCQDRQPPVAGSSS
jgi:hypothetical protein